MRDHSAEALQQLQKRPTDEEIAYAHLLWGENLTLGENAMNLILGHIDCFVSQSRGNERVKQVNLYPHALTGYTEEEWDKFGEAIGNLQKLGTIQICPERKHDDGASEVVPILNWEILARILGHVRQRIALSVTRKAPWREEDYRSLARAIRGHPTIRHFEGGEYFPYECVDTLYSALATLPALESLLFSNTLRPEDESTCAHPESLAELLRVPSLRSVCFSNFYFTCALWQATANALMEGTAITELKFVRISTEESASIIATGLSRNTSVTSIIVYHGNAPALFDALAMALPSNSTIRDLSFLFGSLSAEQLPPIFLALGKNSGLKALKVDMSDSMDESLSTALRDGLGMNETLESLELNSVPLCADNDDLFRRAFSFLRINKALKSMVVVVKDDAKESFVSALRLDVATMLQENISLETLTIRRWNMKIKAEEYLVLITTLQHNKMLKSLNFKVRRSHRLTLNDDEDKQMAALLQKNYALESLPDIDLEKRPRDVNAILRLNAAGRRYLIEDGSSISKGVKVLSAVSNEINCVFLHLLENPRLCDRSAVETVRNNTL
jgi:hypothetical protein